MLNIQSGNQGSILRAEPFSDQVEPNTSVSHENIEIEKVFSIVEEEFRNLSPADIKEGPTVVAQRSLDKAMPQQSGVNLQSLKNLIANFVKASLEIPQCAVLFLSEIDKKRLESMEAQGMHLMSPSLSEEMHPVVEHLEKWKGDVDEGLGNTSGSEAYKELYSLLGPLHTVFRSSQPALPREQQPATNGEVLTAIDEKLAQFKLDIELGDPAAIKASVDSLTESLDLLSEKQQSAFKEITKDAEKRKKETEEKRTLSFIAGAGVAFESSLKGVQSFSLQREHRERQSRATLETVEERGKSFSVSLTTSIDDVRKRPFEDINMNEIFREADDFNGALGEVRGLLSVVKRGLEEDKTSKKGLDQFGKILESRQQALIRDFGKIEKKKNKLCASYESLGLGANVIGSVVGLIPGGGPIAASLLRGANTAAQMSGSSRVSWLNQEQDWILKRMGDHEVEGRTFLNLQSENHLSTQQYILQLKSLEESEIEILRKDPSRHSELLALLGSPKHVVLKASCCNCI